MPLTEEIQGRETWRTRFGFVSAAAGWSIGLGNIWRFPYVTGKYGGGAFLLLYLICMMVVAIPLFTVEFSLGRASRSSITTGYRKLAPGKAWFIGGWFAILSIILVFSYYTMLMGWVVAYFFKTLTAQYFGMAAEQIGELFDSFVQDVGKRLIRRFPAMEMAGSAGGYASLYAVTPDWHPVIDQVPEGSGFYICSGFSGHGFKLGPAVGVMVADMILREPNPEFDPHLFRFNRYQENDLVRGK